MAEATAAGRATANGRAALWMIASATGFAFNGVLVKLLAAEQMPVVQVAFARAFFALLPLLPFLWRDGFAAFRTRHPGTHFLRALCGAGAMLCGFFALAKLPLATVTALGFTAPLFAVVLSVLLLGETVRWRRWSATLVGFGGVLVMVLPGGLAEARLDPAMLLALAMALGIALAMTLVKRFPRGESQPVMLFYFCAASILLTAVPALLQWRAPTAEQWLLLAGVGLVGVAAQAMVITALRGGEISFVAPLDYIKLPVAAVLGYLFFAEMPLWSTYLGAGVIIASTLYIAHRESQLGRRRAVDAPLGRG